MKGTYATFEVAVDIRNYVWERYQVWNRIYRDKFGYHLTTKPFLYKTKYYAQQTTT